MAGNLNSGMCSPLCSDVCAFYLPQGLTGARPCCAALEKRKRKLGVHITIYSYESRFCLLTILMDSQVSKSLKQRFLILLLCRPALHRSLSFRSSNKLQQTVPIIHLFSHSNEKHYKWTRVRLLY